MGYANGIYAEYVNGACSDGYSCTQTYTCYDIKDNYYNGAYRNHSNGSSATYHQNYGNSYLNAYHNGTSCTQYTDHSDHTDYNMSDKGVSKTLTWSSPWGGSHSNRDLNVNYITGSTPAIKQLRDNITSLTSKLHYAANSTAMTDIPDSDFDDGNPATPDLVLTPQNNSMKSNLDKLWAALKEDDDGTTPTIPTKNIGDDINKADWEKLADKTDELAAYADPNYLNHVNYANGVSGGYAGPPD